jgi:hypothetical protein
MRETGELTMSKTVLSNKKADAIGNGLFLIGLAVLVYADVWWPNILLVLWVSLGSRQLLSGRFYDAILCSLLFLGLFLISFLHVKWSVLVPVLLVLGGIHMIFREYCLAEGLEEDPIEENQKEIEDDPEFKE